MTLFENIPLDVVYLKMCAYTKISVGAELYENTVKKYPEYFPEEYDQMIKWQSIPQEVHDKFWEEYQTLMEPLNKALPVNKGMIYYINHPEEYNEQMKAYNAQEEEREKIWNTLHDKYYKPYEINYKRF